MVTVRQQLAPGNGWFASGSRTLAIGAVYFATARMALLLAIPETNATPVWPPTGVAVAALLICGRSGLPGVLLGAVLANLVTFLTQGNLEGWSALLASFLIGLGNAGEAWAACWLLRRFQGDRPHLLSGAGSIIAFSFTAAVAPLISAAIGTACLVYFQVIPLPAWSAVGLTWWVGDAVGMILVCPFIVAWLAPSLQVQAQGYLWERWAMAPIIGVTSWFILGANPSSVLQALAPVMVIGLLLWPCLRFGLREVTSVVVLVAGIAIWHTIHARGPLAAIETNEALVRLQGWIGGGAILLLLISAPRSPLGEVTPTRQVETAIAWRAVVVGIFGLVVSTGLWLLLVRDLDKNRKNQHEVTIVKLTELARSELEVLGAVSQRMADRWAVREGTPEREWRADAQNYKGSFRNILTMEWLDADGFIQWAEPMAGNESLIGRQVNVDPERKRTLDESRRRHQVQTTGFVTLLQGGDGCILFSPIGEDDYFDGWIVTVVRLTSLIEHLREASATYSGKPLSLALRDQNGRASGLSGSAETAFHWAPMPILSKEWALGIPHQAWQEDASDPGTLPVVVLGAGILVSALLAMAIQLSITSQIKTNILQFTNKRLEEESEKAIAGAKAKAAFLATMSHEIRTPMNGVIGSAELLGKTPLTPEQREHIDTIHTSGESLLAIINDILDLSKIESGHLELEEIPCDPEEIADMAVAMVSDRVRQKGLRVYVHFSEDVPLQICSDPVRLRQILLNLVSNAVKFTEHGSITITFDIDKGYLRLRVRDSGIGMSDSACQRLFQAFSQGDVSTTRRFGGTGLGLAICLRLAEALGGTVTVESEVSVGSVFTMVIPLKHVTDAPDEPNPLQGHTMWVALPDPDEQRMVGDSLRRAGMVTATTVEQAEVVIVGNFPDGTPTAAAMPKQSAMVWIGDERTEHVVPRPVRRGRLREAVRLALGGAERLSAAPDVDHASAYPRMSRVLLVEDNPVNLRLASIFLQPHAEVIETAVNGIEAVRKASDHRYDMILMDCQMPEMDGYQATRLIRANEERTQSGHVVIIALTANAFDEDRKACLAAGMDDFLSKPVRPEDLSQLLARHRV